MAGFLSAGARLAVSFLLIPVRAFAGYLLGIVAACCAKMIVVVVGLRRELGSEIPPRPFLLADGRAQLRYLIPLAISLTIWNLVMAWQATVVRLNLTETESAAYFFINRFADVGQWVGLSLIFVAFPLVAVSKADVQGRLLKRSLALTLLAGAVVAVGYWLFLAPVMRSVALWHDYVPYVGFIALYTFRYAMGCAVGAFMSCEQAAGNFRYLLYLVPCVLVECAGLACLRTLGAMLGWLTVTVVVQVVIVLAVVVRRHRGGGVWTRDG